MCLFMENYACTRLRFQIHPLTTSQWSAKLVISTCLSILGNVSLYGELCLHAIKISDTLALIPSVINVSQLLCYYIEIFTRLKCTRNPSASVVRSCQLYVANGFSLQIHTPRVSKLPIKYPSQGQDSIKMILIPLFNDPIYNQLE